MVIFCFFHSFFINWSSSVRKSCPFFPYLVSYLFVSVSAFYFCIGYCPTLVLFILCLTLFQFWPLGVFSGCFLYPFDRPPNFFESFLTFWHRKMLQAYLVFSLPQLWNQPLLQGPLVSFFGEWYLNTRIWMLGVFTAIEILLLLVPGRRQLYVYIYIYTQFILINFISKFII